MDYNSDGKLTTLTAKNPTTGDQVTTYVYGTSTGGVTPEIYRKDLLRSEIYPDSDDTTALGNGTDGTYDRIEYTYNIQGGRMDRKDQNGTVHTYELDDMGRITHDRGHGDRQRRAPNQHHVRHPRPTGEDQQLRQCHGRQRQRCQRIGLRVQ